MPRCVPTISSLLESGDVAEAIPSEGVTPTRLKIHTWMYRVQETTINLKPTWE